LVIKIQNQKELAVTLLFRNFKDQKGKLYNLE